jgi:hypothetical protein
LCVLTSFMLRNTLGSEQRTEEVRRRSRMG